MSSKRTIKDISQNEIIKIIGIILQMGIAKLHNKRTDWAPGIWNSLIADPISRNRFDDIMSILHFNNNNDIPEKKNHPSWKT